jgi:RNA polymerase sigma factor (sigma-70 family)
MEQTQNETGSPPQPGGDDWFTTTHWSIVLAAGETSAPGARQALENLCQTYWYPLYAYVRRRGHSPEDAQDLTQSFFARLLEKKYLHQVDREKGRFRAFLLAALKHFLADEWDKARAQKRGGGRTLISLDATVAEDHYQREPADTTTPEVLYERQWAATVMEQVRTRLRQEYAAEGKGMLYYKLRLLDTGEDREETYAQLASQQGQSVSAIKTAAQRMRRRFGELLRLQIAQTVGSPAEIDEEISHLMAVLGK